MIFKTFASMVGLALLAISSVQAATVTLTPPASAVPVGATDVTISVSGSDFTVPTGGATLGVAFDPAILSLDSVNLSAGSPFDIADLNFGAVSGLNEVSLLAFSDVDGGFPAFELHFTALAQGTSNVSLVDLQTAAMGWVDGLGDPIAGVAYEPPGGTVVNVNVVPLPAAVWLMFSALSLLGLTVRRRA